MDLDQKEHIQAKRFVTEFGSIFCSNQLSYVMAILTENIFGRCHPKRAKTVTMADIAHKAYGGARTIHGNENKFGSIVRGEKKL